MQGPSRLEAGSGNRESAAMARKLHGGTNRLRHCHLDYYVLNFGAHTINVWLFFLNGKIGQSPRVSSGRVPSRCFCCQAAPHVVGTEIVDKETLDSMDLRREVDLTYISEEDSPSLGTGQILG